ncbi:alsin-like protein [Dinothrombium tinctorium]|uniref:Alsin-like protein n=1 Tax=Dinothrombium tinctorium TaxID=1965070 RepID=A0A443RC00_9ACAR|nr:alsin-like protein [Dinothrombium tinctorium]
MASIAETHFWVCNHTEDMVTINELEVNQLCFGEEHCLVLTKDGKIYSFGKNSFGQSGNGETGSEFCLVPLFIEHYENEGELFPLPKISSITCGPYNCAALSSDRRLFIWGANEKGQCLDVDNDKLLRPNYVKIKQQNSNCKSCSIENEELVQFLQVSCGQFHTLALSMKYELWSWGEVSTPQLGIKPSNLQTGTRQPPVKIDFLAGFRVIDISCGYDHSLAVVEANQFEDNCDYYCDSCLKYKTSKEKLNSFSKDKQSSLCPLGLPVHHLSSSFSQSSNSSSTSQLDVSLNNLTDSSIEISERFNSYMESSNFYESENSTSYLTQFVYKVSNAVKFYNRKNLSPNSDNCEFEMLSESMATDEILDENLLSEIENYENSFWAFRRTDSFKNLAQLKSHFRQSRNSDDFDQITLMEAKFSPKFTQSDGWYKNNQTEVWSWGRGDRGQLGQGDTLDRNNPCRIARLSGLHIRRVYASNKFSFALTSSGNVYSWGSNEYGQLGHKDSMNVLSPKLLDFQSPSTCWDIALGSHHCLILADTYFPSVALYYCGGHKKENFPNGKSCSSCIISEKKKVSNICNVKQLNLIDRSLIIKGVFAGGSFSCSLTLSSTDKYSIPNHHLFASFERRFHLLLRLIMRKIFHPLLQDNNFLKESSSNVLHPFTSMVALWSKLKDLVAINSYDARLFLQGRCELVSINMIDNFVEWIEIYKELIDSISNVIAVNGMSSYLKYMCLSPNIVVSLAEEVYGAKSTKKKSAQELLFILFSIPLKRINEYVVFMESFLKRDTDIRQIPSQVLNHWKLLRSYSNNEIKKAQNTRIFWESTSKKFSDFYCIPSRRLMKENKSDPLSIKSTTLPTSSNLLLSHTFTLFNDIFVYFCGQYITIPVETIWIESTDDSLSECEFRLLLPEDKITFCASSPESRTAWISAFNQSIKNALERQKYSDIILIMKKSLSFQDSSFVAPPASRNAFYQFKKHQVYKDATYLGSWVNAKLHGWGDLLWSDGRSFTGNFKDNVQNGKGAYKIPEPEGVTIYEGNWVNGLMKGYGCVKYPNGDSYEGNFENNERNGFGILRCGCFASCAASLYIGEWQNNKRHGYGVLDDIKSGEKFLGSWKDDVKHGNGTVVTVDSIYYEGTFVNDVLTGNGLLIFDDGTVYEGELGPSGLLKGKGVLKLPNGDSIVGIFNGFWSEDVKINGSYKKVVPKNGNENLFNENENPIGKYSIPADEKWVCVFEQCKQLLKYDSSSNKSAWDSIAVSVHNKKREMMKRSSPCDTVTLEVLEKIPKYAQKKEGSLTVDDYYDIKEYLLAACSCDFHPLGILISTLVDVYRSSYIGMGANLRLLPHAVSELSSFVRRIFEIVKFLFPDLPEYKSPLTIPVTEVSNKKSLTIGDIITNEDGQTCLTITASSLLHPILFPSLYPPLFTLYGLKCQNEDTQYWDRLLRWNKQSDMSLMSFLGVDENFYLIISDIDSGPPLRSCSYKATSLCKASEILQHISTAFTPVEKLRVVKESLDEIKREFPKDAVWGMDHLFPIFLFVVVRAKIKNLGAEIHFIQDLMDSHFEAGELGYMFTTLKASYNYIITEKLYNF